MSSIERDRESLDKTPEIPMQDFNDGLPPPPPPSHSWKRIERWLEDNYAELLDNLGEGCTSNDVNELECELDCTLPADVRDSLQIHDGQERGGRPTGLIFGCMLLDCEEIVEEWQNWRAVNEQYLINQPADSGTPRIPVKAFAGPSTSTSSAVPVVQGSQNNGMWRDELQSKQESQPPNAVQKAYAHPSWIPVARDWGGNCLAVDMAPGPMGRVGQVIIFGRDYDCKFVVARSWAAFMATLADDLNSGDKVSIDEESGLLRLQLFKKQGVEPPYLEILRWRCDQKYGRRANKKRASGLKINAGVQGPAFDNRPSSPYASPTSSAPDRGRSPSRLNGNGKAPMGPSPMRPHVSSPLARVAEEASAAEARAPTPLTLRTDSDTLRGPAAANRQDKLISIDTPRQSGDFPSPSRLGATSGGLTTPKENRPPSVVLHGAVEKVKAPPTPTSASDATAGAVSDESLADELKTVAI
jgi:cell wall assembly regulator SMI1